MTFHTRYLVPAVCAVVSLALPLGGCARREVVVVHEAHGPPPCAGGAWAAGHYGPRGAWHPGHWRCPHVVEVVEVD